MAVLYTIPSRLDQSRTEGRDPNILNSEFKAGIYINQDWIALKLFNSHLYFKL